MIFLYFLHELLLYCICNFKHFAFSGSTRAGNGGPQNNGPAAPQRSERPKAVKADKQAAIVEESNTNSHNSNSNSNGNSNGNSSHGYNNGNSDKPMSMTAPRAGGNSGNRPAMNKKRNDDEDDFGDTDVSDLLG